MKPPFKINGRWGEGGGRDHSNCSCFLKIEFSPAHLKASFPRPLRSTAVSCWFLLSLTKKQVWENMTGRVSEKGAPASSRKTRRGLWCPTRTALGPTTVQCVAALKDIVHIAHSNTQQRKYFPYAKVNAHDNDLPNAQTLAMT